MAQPVVRERVAPATRRPDDAQRPDDTQRPDGSQRPDDERPRGFRTGVARIVLGALTTLVSVNLWTGGPVLALWVGSRVQAAVGQLSMAAVGATLGVLIIETYLLYRLLAILTVRYNAAIGRKMRRQQAPWLKPMSGERRSLEVKEPLSAPERIVVVSVVAAVLLFEVWFFFLAGSSLPS